MWSLGCIISELYSGVALFPALDENELLEFHILLSGNSAEYMINEGKNRDKFYNS